MTATSFVSIVNLSLSKLGEYEFITNLSTDATKKAKIFNSNYEQLRDYLLRLHVWNFAKKRVILAPSTTSPVYGGGSYFNKPGDWLGTVSIDDDPYAEYADENNQLLYSGDTLNLLYIARVEDPAKFDPAFIEAYSSLMAYKNAFSITKDLNTQQAMERLYNRDIANAKYCNAIDNSLFVLSSERPFQVRE